MQKTPQSIDEPILRFCRVTLQCEREPVFLELAKDGKAVVQQCYFSVINKIHREGGRIQFGWMIWYEEGHFIEGEFHAVWLDPDGKLIDITPKVDGEKRILFCPDDKTAWNGRFVTNKRLGLSEMGRMLVQAGAFNDQRIVSLQVQKQTLKHYLENKTEAERELEQARQVWMEARAKGARTPVESFLNPPKPNSNRNMLHRGLTPKEKAAIRKAKKKLK